MRLTISDSALGCRLNSILNLRPEFMTSAEVVMKVSGLRFEAVRVIAHEQGVEIRSEESRCIDENLLSLLADAHVRRLRFYFNNSKRHIAGLSGAELATYLDFCKIFKKHQTDSSTAQTWDDIDTDALREQFLKKVHNLTPTLLEELSGGDFEIDERAIDALCRELNGTDTVCDFVKKDNLLGQVLQSYWYYAKPIKSNIADADSRSTVRRVTLSARYHIYSADDKDDILYDTIAINHSINRALKDVA